MKNKSRAYRCILQFIAINTIINNLKRSFSQLILQSAEQLVQSGGFGVEVIGNNVSSFDACHSIGEQN